MTRQNFPATLSTSLITFKTAAVLLTIGLGVTPGDSTAIAYGTNPPAHTGVVQNQAAAQKQEAAVDDEADQGRQQEQVEDQFTAAQLEFFESKVRPLLVEHCFECHGPDADFLEGGLSLASRKAILAGGDSGPGIDLNNPGESHILSAVQYGDLFQMPPDSRLNDKDVEIIRRWVMDRAPWPPESDTAVNQKGEFDLQKRLAEHWAWQPVVRPNLPGVQNRWWVNNPIDAFVLAKLEKAGLEPAKPADRRTWLRRVTFDLTGMPPTDREIVRFVSDRSPDAYARVVDRLLDSPRFGEHWARHWMDLVRYAETHGHEFDYPIANAFQYRDYLIRAFNADVPYDQFLTEHIAGDLLEEPRLHPEQDFNESILGTGFWFLGEATHGPVDVKGDEAGRIDNQIDVMSKTFLGMTVACARCHDHKFDAISARDYYGLAGFLQSSRRQNVMLDPKRKIESRHNQARLVLADASRHAHDFLSKVDIGKDYRSEYAATMQAAVLYLQGDRQWQAPKRVVLEAEQLPILESSAGNPRPQSLNKWSQDSQLWWTEAKTGDQLVLEIDVPVAGQYDLMIRWTTAPDYAKVQPAINGEDAGKAIDLYSAQVDRTKEISLGRFQFDAGPQELGLTLTGKNEKAINRYMVGLDYVVLAATPARINTDEKREKVQTLANRFGVDRSLLENWISAIQSPPAARKDHPLYLLRKSAESNADLTADSADAFYLGLYRDLQTHDAELQKWISGQSEVASPVTMKSLKDWDRQGFAFQNVEMENAKIATRVDLRGDDNRMFSISDTAVHSGLAGDRFQGVLRSPTFEITQPFLYYRVKGHKSQIRLVIDGYRLDTSNPLLFNQMKLDINTDGQWLWVKQGGDLKNYIGHRAFIELIDQGDGHIAVQEIRQASHDRPGGQLGLTVLDSGFHYPDAGPWHDARFNQGANPLQLVAQATAASLQTNQMVSAERSEITNAAVFGFMLGHDLIPNLKSEHDQLIGQLKVASKKLRSINDSVPKPVLAVGMVDGSGENEHLFVRGNHKNLGDRVPRSPITALRNADTWPTELKGSGRLQLAKNMLDPRHPLTTRVMVNRIWHHMFGQGLVPSVDNFGVLGAKPTHPELLDHLAYELSTFWSIKKIIRRIALSKTYQMSSSAASFRRGVDFTDIDPNNDLLWRFRIRRLPGESIRDSMLAVSGQLDPKMFGPSVPIHLTEFMQGRGRPGRSGPLDGKRRRSIYIETRRNFLSPMMLAFDTPIPFNTIGRRSNSNVPAQALILMNDPFVIDQADKWARQLIDLYPDQNERLERAFRAALARPPKPTEKKMMAEFVAGQTRVYQVENSEADDSQKRALESEQRAWADLCHVIFNMKEFIYIE